MYRFRPRSLVVVLCSVVVILVAVAFHQTEVSRRNRRDYALIEAVHGNKLQATLSVLRSGADPNVRSYRKGWGRMGTAHSLTRIADRMLPSYTTDSNAPTALMWAVHHGSKDLVISLLDAGADVNAHGPDGQTALMWAVTAIRGDVVSILVKRGAHLDTKDIHGSTALHCCLSKDIARTLLFAGANRTLSDESGHVAMMNASVQAAMSEFHK